MDIVVRIAVLTIQLYVTFFVWILLTAIVMGMILIIPAIPARYVREWLAQKEEGGKPSLIGYLFVSMVVLAIMESAFFVSLKVVLLATPWKETVFLAAAVFAGFSLIMAVVADGDRIIGLIGDLLNPLFVAFLRPRDS